MKFALTKDHFTFFYQNHYIGFDGLLTKNACTQLKEALFSLLATRLKTTPPKLPFHPMHTLLKAGFESWRDDDMIKKALFRSELAELASELTKERTLRIGYDQALLSPNDPYRENLPPIFEKEMSLEAVSCIQGISCGLLLHLDGPPADLPYFPQSIGSGTYLSPDLPLKFDALLNAPRSLYLLLVYVKDKAVFRLCQDDPNTHAYKKKGYVFGDRLQNHTHPILFRH